MSALNCKVGDIAITVRCEVKANLGKMVRIIGSHGLDSWSSFEQPVHLWLIESIGNRRICYEFPDGRVSRRRRGLAPDAFLRPIRDPGELVRVSTADELVIEV